MNRARLLTTLLGSVCCAAPALATPYCDALMVQDQVAKRYQKLAPIHSSAENGWIFPNEHLRETYHMKPLAQALTEAVVAEFAAQNQRLGILIAPPRPIVAGPEIMAETLTDTPYDMGAARQSFDQLIAELNATGAVVPNLADTATADPVLADSYYFTRDTHWTPLGAALSAHSFADLAEARWPGVFATDTEFTAPSDSAELYEEKGSLAAVVEDTCGTRPAREIAPLIPFEGGLERGLLGDLPEGTPRIALLGTSFSDRYDQDAYRVAPALEHALGAEVTNGSFTGGGMIGSLETFILNNGLRGGFDAILWETPYTQSFNSTSNLYQLLGALGYATGAAEGGAELSLANITEADLPVAEAPAGVTFVTDNAELRRITLSVTYNDGKTETIKLQRSQRIPAEQRVDRWSARFLPRGERVITGLRAAFSPSAAGPGAKAVLWGQD